ncbi:hypothetical protein [Bradyrhizobium sp.]|nr:hypothetical protein [Bradyrhizobium sp.]MDE2376944.1 hypothetical protein [Bradyrhizobium sp.]
MPTMEMHAIVAMTAPRRDEIAMNRHRALGYCLNVVFSENRVTFPDHA